jgi:hypothetical protein
MRATAKSSGGVLNPLDKCMITVGDHTITLRILPEITDSKSASYNDEPIIGRSYPIKTYRYSENRVVSMKLHFVTLEHDDGEKNLKDLRALQSAVYPIDDDGDNPYLPPPVCKIQCGFLFTSKNSGSVCAILKSYSVSFPTDVVWDEDSYLPFKFDVDLQWEIVFSSTDLPGHNMIIGDV